MTTTVQPRLRPAQPAWDVARLFPDQGSWSDEEYLDLTEETHKLVELTHGRLELLPMPSTSHQFMLGFLFGLLSSFVKEHQAGHVAMAPLRVRLRPGEYREPDIVYIASANRAKISEQFWDGADLVMEIVSPKGRRRDLVLKRHDYAEAGIGEYWIVDPAKKSITVLSLVDGRYEELGVYHKGENAGSAILDGFGVSVAEVLGAGYIR